MTISCIWNKRDDGHRDGYISRIASHSAGLFHDGADQFCDPYVVESGRGYPSELCGYFKN